MFAAAALREAISDGAIAASIRPRSAPLSGFLSNSVTIPFFPLQILVLAVLKIFRDAHRPKRVRSASLGCAAHDIGIQRDEETSAALQTESKASVGSLTLVSFARRLSRTSATGNALLAAAVTCARYRRETRARTHPAYIDGSEIKVFRVLSWGDDGL
jgi:hypothetical protein